MQHVFTGQLLKSRGGAVLVGAAAALVAAILLVVYLRSYRSSVSSGTRAMTVLVAKSLIHKGTSGKLIASEGLYQVTTVPKSELKASALSDPASLHGTIAADDIYPGQQLTAEDFAPAATGGLSSGLSGSERAIAVTVDGEHGLIGQVRAGDHVDVYVAVGGSAGPLLKLLAADVPVLVAPGTGSGSNAVLEVAAGQVPRFALAADYARVWLVLRPLVGATKTPPTSISLQALVAAQAQAG